MPDNAAITSSVSSAIKNKHSAMATFDNPSYFTISGQTGIPSSPIETADSTAGAKAKKFKSWFKLSKRAFRSKASLNDASESDANNLASDGEIHERPGPTKPGIGAVEEKRELPDVVYYNFAPAPRQPAADEPANDDDVFSETCVNRSTRTLNRRRHSIGSWFRSSLAAVRKNHATAASTGSGLEASGASRSAERPSTSSERALLSRHVSASAHCVSYSSNRDAQTPEATCAVNQVARSAESKANKRPRLPVSIKSTVELRARARYARQEKLMRSDGAIRSCASVARIPRSAQSPHQARHHAQTASLDRRYTNSTEVLASKSEESGSAVPGPSRPASERGDENSREDSTSSSRRRTLGGSASSSALVGRQQRFVARSRTIEDRACRTSCCGRAAAAVAVSSCRPDRRRASFDNSSLIRRRCPRCRDKAEPIDAKKVDVVIVFSRNCVVASQWVTYLTAVLNNIFLNEERPSTRVTSRDVESLVHCDPQFVQGSERQFAKNDYQNEAAAEKLDSERSASQRAMRKTVETASMQIVLLSKPFLRHVGQHANDPLGQLLHPKKVIGLLLGLDESTDITPLHISALYSFAYWPKIAMLDQDMESVGRFRQLARDILSRSQPIGTGEPRTKVRFKLAPRKLRPGEERVTVLLLETADGIQITSTVHVGVDLVNKPVRVEKLSWLNPYTFSFNVPREFLDRGITIRVQLKVKDVPWGVVELKCQNKLAELSRLLDRTRSIGSPIDVMCKVLDISPSDTEALDKAFVHALDRRRVPLAGHFRTSSTAEQSDQEFPTLLHFAARFGFRLFFWALLESSPFAFSALNIHNRQGLTVMQLAEAHGHSAFLNDLKSILQVIEKDGNVTSPADLTEPINEEDDYVSPSAKMPGYDVLPAPTPVRTVNSQDSKTAVSLNTEEGDYVTPVHLANYRAEGNVDAAQIAVMKQLNSVLQSAFLNEPSRMGASSRYGSNDSLTATREEQVGSIPCTESLKRRERLRPLGSRVNSPYTSWSSSDRSSVASHLSQDSGTHSESTDEKKSSKRSDYDVPGKGMANYLVPPPPRPFHPETHGQSTPKPSPRLPRKNRRPLEDFAVNPPASQNTLGEDLGRILPDEEPDIFVQPPIPLPSDESSRDMSLKADSDYLDMTPRCTRKLIAALGTTEADYPNRKTDDDYLRSEEINAPNASASVATRRNPTMRSFDMKASAEDLHKITPRAGKPTTPTPARRRNLPPRQ